MKNFYSILMALSIPILTFAQHTQTLTLQPGPDDGKDMVIWSHWANSNLAGTNDEDFLAIAWTWDGSDGLTRSLIDFDLSSIPVGSTIRSANLYLFYYPGTNNPLLHSVYPGSGNTADNSCIFERITQNWDENTVTWNNQPSSTNVNSVVIPVTTSHTQDLVADLTGMVQDYVNDPANSFGFMFKLRNEYLPFRGQVYGTSDALITASVNLRPKIVVEYEPPTAVDNVDLNDFFKIYPNPSNGIFHVQSVSGLQLVASYSVIDILGRLLEHYEFMAPTHDFDFALATPGQYILQIKTRDDQSMSTQIRVIK